MSEWIRNKDLKKRYLAEGRKCHWCRRECVDLGDIEAWIRLNPGRPTPSNMATIDHLVSRFFRKRGESVEKVLACYRCNQNRARKEDRYFRKIRNNTISKHEETNQAPVRDPEVRLG